MVRDKRLDMRPTHLVELMLIRAGQHLWRSRRLKEWPESALSSSLLAIWEAKRSLRAKLREEWLEYVKNRQNRLVPFARRAT